MKIANKKQKLLELFVEREAIFNNSMKYAKSEQSKIRRVFYGFKKFGFPYFLYNLVRFNTPILLKNIHGKLFFGRKMVWPASDIGASVLSMYGISPHKSERRLARWLIKNLEDAEVFYDIGAHLGYYTAIAEEVIEKGEAHGFEANSNLCKYLHKNFSDSKKVYIACGAVADHVGEVDFYDATKTEDSSASSRFRLSEAHVSPIKIYSTTLDEYVKIGNKAPTMIKLDVEGGEYDVIVGALDIIREHKPRIIMEVWGGEIGRKYSDKAVKKIQEFGYKAFSIKNDGFVSEESIDDPVGSIKNLSDGARDNFLFLANE